MAILTKKGNRGRMIPELTKGNDSHALPITQKIDFDAVACALREIDYAGYITLEVEHYCCNSAPETVPEKVQNMYRAARKLGENFVIKQTI